LPPEKNPDSVEDVLTLFLLDKTGIWIGVWMDVGSMMCFAFLTGFSWSVSSDLGPMLRFLKKFRLKNGDEIGDFD
jgi:hypothetical protein